MVNDTISDLLTRIRNGIRVKSQTVSIPFTRISHQLSIILEREGFIQSFQLSAPSTITLYLRYTGREKKSGITNLQRISKPGLRIYNNYKEIPLILGGIGIVIVSTSKGLMTDRDARFHRLGGEILCSIW